MEEPAAAAAAAAAPTLITEGAATVELPPQVFYNPVQEFNRDLTVEVLRAFVSQRREEQPSSSAPTVLEALSATGLRSIRYCKEVAGLGRIVANDLSPHAVHVIAKNVARNGLTTDQVQASQGDASMVMYQARMTGQQRYDIVDLDPYGSSAKFLDAAVQSVAEGGLLAVTCTDMAVLCGNRGEAAWVKYGSYPLRGPSVHETALRVVLASIEAHANRYHRYIVPLLACSVDFYVRLFLRVYSSNSGANLSASKQAYYYQCSGCHSFHLQRIGRVEQNDRCTKFGPAVGPPIGPHCEHCGFVFHMGGPVWAEPIHSPPFVQRLLSSLKSRPPETYKNNYSRLLGFITLISEEVTDSPFYYSIRDLAGTLHCTTPSMVGIRSALLNAGYRVSGSHANEYAIKTNASPSVMWDLMRDFVAEHPVVQKNIKPNSPAARILAKPAPNTFSFKKHPNADPPSKTFHMVRFPMNPRDHWGPMSRPGKHKNAKSSSSTPNDSLSASASAKRAKSDPSAQATVTDPSPNDSESSESSEKPEL